jgi:hypothetical protein
VGAVDVFVGDRDLLEAGRNVHAREVSASIHEGINYS